MKKPVTPLHLQRGGLMVEVLVSVLLLSVSVLGLVRVLGTSLQDSGDMQYRSEAATIADELVGRMWVNRAALDSYVTDDPEPIPRLPGGTREVISDGGNVYRIIVSWQAPGAPGRSSHEVRATLIANQAATAAPAPEEEDEEEVVEPEI